MNYNSKLSESEYIKQKNKIYIGLLNVVTKLKKKIKIIDYPIIISDDDNLFYIYFMPYNLYKKLDVCEVRLSYKDSYNNLHITDPNVTDLNKYYERVIKNIIDTANDIPKTCDICYKTMKDNFGCNICSFRICCKCYKKIYKVSIDNNKKIKCSICRYK